MQVKYTKELLSNVVSISFSISDVIRKLGMKISGGTHSHLKNRIEQFGISTEHFSRDGCNRGKVPTNKKPFRLVLIKSERKYREDCFRLRRALIESGRKYQCEKCGLGEIWNNKKIVIQIDHINGIWSDNRKENLRFLCPNCHSQTKTFSSRNIKVYGES